MKSVLIAAALALPLPAAAQSLNDTHELVWQPAGKTPPVVYRERGRAACAETVSHHQAGKGAMPAKRKCGTADATKAPAAKATDAMAR
ncbi:MAG: hypothetical protein ACTHJR_09005 [Sphingomonas sp.]|uniref:hypothetical protein n=1 Tax=Sphingomonas sp. TaxID=28214 RepID=UPI003F8034CB